jgi:hypothetical protein
MSEMEVNTSKTCNTNSTKSDQNENEMISNGTNTFIPIKRSNSEQDITNDTTNNNNNDTIREKKENNSPRTTKLSLTFKSLQQHNKNNGFTIKNDDVDSNSMGRTVSPSGSLEQINFNDVDDNSLSNSRSHSRRNRRQQRRDHKSKEDDVDNDNYNDDEDEEDEDDNDDVDVDVDVDDDDDDMINSDSASITNLSVDNSTSAINSRAGTPASAITEASSVITSKSNDYSSIIPVNFSDNDLVKKQQVNKNTE